MIIVFHKILLKPISLLFEYAYESIYLTTKYILGCELTYDKSQVTLKDKILLISNHPTVMDFIFLLHWAKQYNRSKDIYFIAKDSIGNAPIIGKYMKEHLCLISRDYEQDREKIERFCEKLSEKKQYILIIFPEGTTIAPEAKEKSLYFSEKNDKPIFENVLYPRHKGLELILKKLLIEQVIDITLFYKDDVKVYKTNYDKNLLFDSYAKHGTIIAKELPLDKVNPNQISSLLEKRWIVKDLFIKHVVDHYIRE